VTSPLFAPGETVSSTRLRLSAMTVEALQPLLEWLTPSALAPDWMLDDLIPHVEAGHTVRVSDLEDVTMGLAVALESAPDAGAAIIPLLAIAPNRRFVGLGGEAGLALEAQIRARWGAQRIYAPVPDGRGLAVYFWLRLGYRPLQLSEAPWPLAGLSAEPRPGIWMLRDDPA
jgi:hypothetical protein